MGGGTISLPKNWRVKFAESSIARPCIALLCRNWIVRCKRLCIPAPLYLRTLWRYTNAVIIIYLLNGAVLMINAENDLRDGRLQVALHP